AAPSSRDGHDRRDKLKVIPSRGGGMQEDCAGFRDSVGSAGTCRWCRRPDRAVALFSRIAVRPPTPSRISGRTRSLLRGRDAGETPTMNIKLTILAALVARDPHWSLVQDDAWLNDLVRKIDAVVAAEQRGAVERISLMSQQLMELAAR